MKKNVFLILLCITFGCSKSDNPITSDRGVSWDQLGSAPRVDVPKENFPEWLVVRINDYYETRPPSIFKAMIYKGKWNKQTIYFILDTFSSCLCDFFTENGERISENNLSALRITSENWLLIYEYGEFVLNLDELFKN